MQIRVYSPRSLREEAERGEAERGEADTNNLAEDLNASFLTGSYSRLYEDNLHFLWVGRVSTVVLSEVRIQYAIQAVEKPLLPKPRNSTLPPLSLPFTILAITAIYAQM